MIASLRDTTLAIVLNYWIKEQIMKMHSFTTNFTIKNTLRRNNSVRCWNCKSILSDGDLWRNKQLSIKYNFDFDADDCLCDYCTNQRDSYQHENFND